MKIKKTFSRLILLLGNTYILNRILGVLSSYKMPHGLLQKVIDIYCKIFGVALDEYVIPEGGFETFNQFFTRKFKPGARKFHPAALSIISPVEGSMISQGSVINGKLFQVKGIEYSLLALLGDNERSERILRSENFRDGTYITIYLSPGDYHLIHYPVSGKLLGYRYIPGTLFPVNSLGMNSVEGLFAKNERLITSLESKAGEVAIVKVGAALVGKIRTTHDDKRTREKMAQFEVCFSELSRVKKGDELGAFEMGSTVILIFRKGKVRLKNFKVGERVKLGEKIGVMLQKRGKK